MCGIAGLVSYTKNLYDDTEIIKNMISTLSYRGPDSYGIYVDKHVQLGHKRLIVVDPKGGIQPMKKSLLENEYTIVYNGELYNTADIRKKLLSFGYTFNSYSDTEVLLTSYIHWKENCVNYLNGIFSFAIWDKFSNKLFIARDPVGVKPLYYSFIKDTFIFGSEIKTILAHPDSKAILNEESLLELFSLGPSTNLGSGVFKDIREVPPAHCGYVTPSGFNMWEYWQLPILENNESESDAIMHLQDLLTDAITRQLVGDVPLCAFLSGGLDSSAISAIASSHLKKSNKTLTTYSIDYDGNDKFFNSSEFIPSSDQYWALEMSKFINSNHITVKLSNDDLANSLKDAVIARDLPGMADIDSSLLLFCKEIRKDFVIGLSGECADEIFGGYPWFLKEDLINSSNFPWSLNLDSRKNLLNSSLKHLDLSSFAKDKYDSSIAKVPVSDLDSPFDKRMRELFYINIKWFMVNLLTRKDRMSMRNSLEVRVPFADYRLIEYAFNLPSKLKFIDGREKGLLRKALVGILPNDIIYRKKSPYPKTHNPVYTDLVCNQLTSMISNKSCALNYLIDEKFVKSLLESKGSSFTTPWYGQLMTGPQLIAYILQIGYWLEEYNVDFDF